MGNRMHKFYAAGMKTDTTVGVGTRITIFQIATDWATDIRQLTANLVVPPSFQINFQQAIIIASGNNLVMENRFFRIGSTFRIGERLVQLLDTHKIVDQGAFGIGWAVFTIAQYFFVRLWSRKILFIRDNAFEVLAKTTTPLVGLSSRCVTPINTLPGLLYFSFRYS